MRIAIINLGTIVTGDWRQPFADGDTIIINGKTIEAVGSGLFTSEDDYDLVVDANGTTVCPGLIDSHVHISFGDYTPKQQAVGFLQSYLHGGTTTCISASEVHVAGRPNDREGVKALAVTAHKCFENFRPGGMRVHGGSIILEPCLQPEDFAELRSRGVWLAKAGFGSVKTPMDYVPLAKAARDAGMIVNAHTGGASISLANSIFAEHLIAMRPHVSFHVNGGPIAMPDEDFARLIDESDIALQICQAGNIRTSLLCLNLAVERDVFDRFLIATDTPTGTGMMPLGMIKTITEMATLSDHSPEAMIAAATGNAARVYGLDCGLIEAGKDADLILVDAPMGGTQKDCLSAIKHGDVWSLIACITAGVPRFIGRSRNTPPPLREAKVTSSKIRQEFAVSQQFK
ncbi:MAG: amidohydrolase family protein [Pseudomonadota bacterium]|nr:amidohydrolase family protein [Pseudomonadota bacterium]